MEPRRIAIIAGQLLVGGAERQLHLWLSNLDRRRFKPVVLTLHPGHGDYWEPMIERMGVPIIPVERRRNRIARIFDMARRLRAFRPEIVHGWHLFASPYAGVVGRMVGARTTFGSLRGSFESFQQTKVQAQLSLSLTRGMIVNSPAAAEYVAAAHPRSAGKVHLVPNAVEAIVRSREEARHCVSRRWGLPEGNVWIGSMGRFDPLKRFDLLLEAMAALRKEHRAINLLMIGYGSQMQELKTRAEALGISDCVVFTGPDPEARQWLSALDIFCFPSMDEGLPNVVLESSVAGAPVVAWRMPYLKGLLAEGESVLLAEPGNVQQLTQAMARMIRQPELRVALGRAARKRVLEEFSVERYVERMTRVYEQ